MNKGARDLETPCCSRRGSWISPFRIPCLLARPVHLHALPIELALTLGGEGRGGEWFAGTLGVLGGGGRREREASGPAACAPVPGGASRPPWGGGDPRRDARGAGASALETRARETQTARRSGRGRVWRPRHYPEQGRQTLREPSSGTRAERQLQETQTLGGKDPREISSPGWTAPPTE